MANREYKIGDIVKVVNGNEENVNFFRNGAIGTIVEIEALPHEKPFYEVDFKYGQFMNYHMDSTWFVVDDEIELLDMTKNELDKLISITK